MGPILMRLHLCLASILTACGGGDGGRGAVRVTVVNEGTPGVGLTAVFLDPEGVELARGLTDDRGQVTAEVESGATVTLVETFSLGGAQLWSVTGLEPGDDIRLGRTLWGEPAGSMTVSFPEPDGGAGDFELHHACSSSFGTTTTMQADFYSQCARDRVDFLVEERGAEQFLQLLDVPLVDGESVTVPGDSTSWHPTREVGVDVRGPNLDRVTISWIVESANGTEYENPIEDSGLEQRTFRVPDGFGSRSRAILSTPTETGALRQERVYPGVPDQVLIDVGDPGFLPELVGAAIDSHVLEIRVSGDGDWDMSQLLMDFTADDGTDVLWSIAAPGGTTEVDLTALVPSDLASLLPPAGETGATAELLGIDGDGDLLRQRPWSPREAVESARPGESYILQFSQLIHDAD